MRPDKRNSPRKVSRRNFIGTCTAGASMIGLSPLLGLTGCDVTGRPAPGRTGPQERPLIFPEYLEGKIRIRITFPKPHTCLKNLQVDGTGQLQDFEMVWINKTGTLNRGGFPEVPYLGLLVHIPEAVSFGEPVLADPSILSYSFGQLNVYPAQTDCQDNENYLNNYRRNAQYEADIYAKLNSPHYVPLPAGSRVDEFEREALLRFPEEILDWTGPFYLGPERFYRLGVKPFYFKAFQDPDQEGQTLSGWLFLPEVSIDIPITELIETPQAHHFEESPYLPSQYLRSPVHERIIDPWRNRDEVQQIFPGFTDPYKKQYMEVGPDLVIFYPGKSAGSDSLVLPALKLLQHKQEHGFPHAIASEIEDPGMLDSPEKVRARIEQLAFSSISSGSNQVPVSRLRAVLVMGDVGGIRNADLISYLECPAAELESAETGKGPAPAYYSDFACSAPGPRGNIRRRWPWLLTGRIPASTRDDALQVVNSIIAYETGNEPVRNRLSLSAYFQDRGQGAVKPDGQAARDYLQCVEEIRECLDIDKTEVEMIYTREPSGIADRDLLYRDGTSLSPDIRFLGTEESKERIRNAFREGKRIMVHRDHGWMNGWAHPDFKIPDLWKLGSLRSHLPGERPFILFSINCLTGRYTGEMFGSSVEGAGGEACDQPAGEYSMPVCSNDCFAEAVLQGVRLPNGQHLRFDCPAVVSSTEVSPSFENDWFLKIMFDRIYGGILTPGEQIKDPDSRPTLGQVLNEAKMLLHAYQGDRCRHLHENIAFHILGDPTLII